MHVNLPNEWKTSSYGIKYFRCEGFDYDVWQKNAVRMRQTITYECRLGLQVKQHRKGVLISRSAGIA